MTKRKKILEYIVDETLIELGSGYIRLWVAIKPKQRPILQIDISFKRNMLIAERLVSSLINTYGRYPVSTDGGTWYPQDFKFLKLKHHLHCPSEKSIIERTIHYIKAGLNALMITFHVNSIIVN